jgi:hypothetical protein
MPTSWTSRTGTSSSWTARVSGGDNYEYDYDDPYDSAFTYDGAVSGNTSWGSRSVPSTSWTAR